MTVEWPEGNGNGCEEPVRRHERTAEEKLLAGEAQGQQPTRPEGSHALGILFCRPLRAWLCTTLFLFPTFLRGDPIHSHE